MLNLPLPLFFVLFSFIVAVYGAPTGNEDRKEGDNNKEELRKLMAEINRKNAEKLAQMSEAQDKDDKLKEHMEKLAKRRKENQGEVHNEKRKSIPELNADIPDADTYYQGDMILTLEQAKQKVESTDEGGHAANVADEGGEGKSVGAQDDGHNVAKRQALNLAYYTASQWPNGNVYYTFDSSVCK